MDPDNPVIKQLEERKARLNLLEKKLEMQMDEYETKLAMVNKNIEKCDETIKNSIK
jgi:chaperonin cofactor prefoldin